MRRIEAETVAAVRKAVVASPAAELDHLAAAAEPVRPAAHSSLAAAADMAEVVGQSKLPVDRMMMETARP